jgi:hypothetical protein
LEVVDFVVSGGWVFVVGVWVFVVWGGWEVVEVSQSSSVVVCVLVVLEVWGG